MNMFEAINSNHTQTPNPITAEKFREAINSAMNSPSHTNTTPAPDGSIRPQNTQIAIVLGYYGNHWGMLSDRSYSQFQVIIEEARQSLMAKSKQTPTTRKIAQCVLNAGRETPF